MFEPVTLTGGIIITKAVVAKATAASAAYAVTVVAVNAAITGAIAGGSSAVLVTYLSTPCGRKVLKSVITDVHVRFILFPFYVVSRSHASSSMFGQV
jgi:hypothetical protein